MLLTAVCGILHVFMFIHGWKCVPTSWLQWNTHPITLLSSKHTWSESRRHTHAHIDVAPSSVLCVLQERQRCSRVCKGISSHCVVLEGMSGSFVTGADQSRRGRVNEGHVDALWAVLGTNDLSQAFRSGLAQQLACNKNTHTRYILFKDENTNILYMRYI